MPIVNFIHYEYQCIQYILKHTRTTDIMHPPLPS